MIKRMFLLLIVLVLINSTSFAQKEDGNSSPTFYLETSFANKYAWRGII